MQSQGILSRTLGGLFRSSLDKSCKIRETFTRISCAFDYKIQENKSGKKLTHYLPLLYHNWNCESSACFYRNTETHWTVLFINWLGSMRTKWLLVKYPAKIQAACSITLYIEEPILGGGGRVFTEKKQDQKVDAYTVRQNYEIPGLFLTKPSRDSDWANYSRPGRVW